MSDIFPPDAYLSDPQRNHRRQVVWQIYLPLTVGAAALLFLGIMVLLANTGGNPEVERWAAIAAIWIILPILALGIAILLVSLLMIFLMSKISGVLPDYSRLAQFYLYRISIQIQRLADRLVAPDIALESRIAGWKRLFGIFRAK